MDYYRGSDDTTFLRMLKKYNSENVSCLNMPHTIDYFGYIWKQTNDQMNNNWTLFKKNSRKTNTRNPFNSHLNETISISEQTTHDMSSPIFSIHILPKRSVFLSLFLHTTKKQHIPCVPIFETYLSRTSYTKQKPIETKNQSTLIAS